MSRGINLVGLNRRQDGDTGDSTPGSCAVGSVNHDDCSPRVSIGAGAFHGWQTPVELHAEQGCS